MQGFDQALTANESRAWQRVSQLLQRLAESLGMPLESSRIHQSLSDAARQLHNGDEGDAVFWMVRTANQLGLHIAPVDMTFDDLISVILEGIPVARFVDDGNEANWWLIRRGSFGGFDAQIISDSGSVEKTFSKRQLRRQLKFSGSQSKQLFFLAESTSIGHGVQAKSDWETQDNRHGHDAHHGHDHAQQHGHHHGHHHLSPLTRVWALIRLETRDIANIALFSIVVGILGLASPIAVEALVNTVAFGRYLQPIIILSLIVFTFLAFAGFLRLVQTVTVEIIQRRMMVRIVGDLFNRIPSANVKQWDEVWGPELSNRFFDVFTLQKASTALLLDGIALVLQTFIGMALLAFYHPFLLGFDIVLLIVMAIFIFILGRGGIRTAQAESVVKYKVAHWLEDVSASTTAFKIHGGRQLAVDRANRLMGEYLVARERHFTVIFRQVFAGMMIYAVASTALLGLGGWLVTTGQLNLGQLVAAELIVTAILGSFTKIGKQLESFFDMAAGLDKLGYLLDLETDPPGRVFDFGVGPAPVRWKDLKVSIAGKPKELTFPDFEIASGETIAIVGESGLGKSVLAELLVGMRQPDAGYVEVDGIDAREAARLSDGGFVALAGPSQIFHGTIAENVHLGRPAVTDADVRESLRRVVAWDEILLLKEGLETSLLTGGKPLSSGQIDRLMVARAIVGNPRVLVLDGTLDSLPITIRQQIWANLTKEKSWTVIIITNEPDLIEKCDRTINLCGSGDSSTTGKMNSSKVFA
jgi:putative ABC transport system ATP-binding protein